MTKLELNSMTGRGLSILRIVTLCCVVAMVSTGCATMNNVDPYEGFNRKVMAFNDGADKLFLNPLALGYLAATPKPVRQSVHNVFANLNEPTVIINQFLQGKGRLGLQDTARFLINTTLGIAGLFDVAAKMGLARHNEDFGQTLGSWGAGSGAYLIIPFWGPVTTRDGIGDIANSYTYLPRYIDHPRTRNQVLGLGIIDKRAYLLGAEELIQGDRYLFIRDAYLQSREFLTRDGEVEEDPFLEIIEGATTH